MLNQLRSFARRIPLPTTTSGMLFAALGLALLVWILGRVVWSTFYLAWFLGLIAATGFLLRPELNTLLAWNGDQRPWLVRIREHRWQPLQAGGIKLPRSIAYLMLAVAWWLTL